MPMIHLTRTQHVHLNQTEHLTESIYIVCLHIFHLADIALRYQYCVSPHLLVNLWGLMGVEQSDKQHHLQKRKG